MAIINIYGSLLGNNGIQSTHHFSVIKGQSIYVIVIEVLSYHHAHSLSPTQVQDEYNYLRTLFPEIESVQIGTQRRGQQVTCEK